MYSVASSVFGAFWHSVWMDNENGMHLPLHAFGIINFAEDFDCKKSNSFVSIYLDVILFQWNMCMFIVANIMVQVTQEVFSLSEINRTHSQTGNLESRNVVT